MVTTKEKWLFALPFILFGTSVAMALVFLFVLVPYYRLLRFMGLGIAALIIGALALLASFAFAIISIIRIRKHCGFTIILIVFMACVIGLGACFSPILAWSIGNDYSDHIRFNNRIGTPELFFSKINSETCWVTNETWTIKDKDRYFDNDGKLASYLASLEYKQVEKIDKHDSSVKKVVYNIPADDACDFTIYEDGQASINDYPDLNLDQHNYFLFDKNDFQKAYEIADLIINSSKTL